VLVRVQLTTMKLNIAAAGSPKSTPKPGGSLEGVKRVAELGLTALELEWVQRVPENIVHAQELHDTAQKHNVLLTVHAPYFINLNAKDPEKLDASIHRILSALRMGKIVGAKSVCVHPAFYLGDSSDVAYKNVYAAMESIMTFSDDFTGVNLGLETMGKPTQFGTLEENLQLSKEFGLYPVVDFAHLHARSNGNCNTLDVWKECLDLYVQYLGAESLNTMHIHYSGIAYSEKGERHHLPFADSDARWQEFLQFLHVSSVGGVLVCESPLLEDDTLLLQQFYDSL
jgi:deoxyribonuclease IV